MATLPRPWAVTTKSGSIPATATTSLRGQASCPAADEQLGIVDSAGIEHRTSPYRRQQSGGTTRRTHSVAADSEHERSLPANSGNRR